MVADLDETLSSIGDSSVLVASVVANLWNFGLCLQAPYISEQVLMACSGFNLVSFRMASLSFIHSLQFLVPNVLTVAIGSPCQRMSILSRMNSLISLRSVLGGISFAK